MQTLEQIVKDYLTPTDNQTFERYKFAYERINQDLLTPQDIEVLKLILLTPIHDAQFIKKLRDKYPVDSVDPARVPETQIWSNRQMQHMIARWADRKDRHRHAIELYLRTLTCGRRGRRL